MKQEPHARNDAALAQIRRLCRRADKLTQYALLVTAQAKDVDNADGAHQLMQEAAAINLAASDIYAAVAASSTAIA